MLISGPEQLARFRQRWTGKKMLDLVQQHNGRLRVDWDIGVGKSYSIDNTIEAAIRTDKYDLVIALFPIRQIINERNWIIKPPEDVRILNLIPRPKYQCGPIVNSSWEVFEKNGLGALGRIKLCEHCQWEKNCPWPTQLGKSLQDKQVIFGTQAHLERSASFIEQIITWGKAQKALILLDEVNFVMKSFHRHIKKKHLIIFLEVLNKLNPKCEQQHKKWVYLTELLLNASTEDLRCNEWKMPRISYNWSIAVQSSGYDMYSDKFFFLPFDLVHFGESSLESRERAKNGDILFAATPRVKGDFIIYSGTANNKFSEFRLGAEFANPFKEHRFEHPETVWYNIASRLGAKIYFPKNSPQVFDFFAGLIALRLSQGKRPLLITKKFFLPLCAQEIQTRLRSLGINEAKVVINCLDQEQLAAPFLIPLIHFGTIGTNLFQDFDCAYCLTGYYVDEEAVNGILQDVTASDMKIPLKISIEGSPLRRKAGVLNSSDRFYDINYLAQYALDQQEMDTVVQAVGRVRPYTKPREVITFQCAKHPKIEYTKEFISIGEARNYFGIKSRRELKTELTINNIQIYKAKGLKQVEVTRKLDVTIRTVKRYWNLAKR